MENLFYLQDLVEDMREKNIIMINLIKEGLLGNFLEDIKECNRVFIYGGGNFNIIGEYFKGELIDLGKNVFDFYKEEELKEVLNIINRDECLIIIDLYSSKNYLEKIKEDLDKREIKTYFLGEHKDKKVPICTFNLGEIENNLGELELYIILIRFLKELLKEDKNYKLL